MKKVQVKVLVPVLSSLLLSSCASVTGSKRVVYGAGIGASTGAVGGALLSPNSESRGMNALVFGLSGALVGGVVGLLTDSHGDTPKAPPSPELSVNLQSRNQDYPVLPKEALPDFVSERLKPVIIEEFIEADHVGEDGSLHEPHKVYRIKQPAELFSRPVARPVAKTGGSP